ncbi:efflux RND transporter periplasmic adaptor subunit [Reinekea sp.]|jgi:multidrug efflux pump subunit AcrA (membrane-fusion protein)|uniref:efflux RND transporter periplasmic adaptor subunit n=1 Tax=Reinekea sp. TaxID=1970455 RepID=UPI003988DA87
MKFWQKSVAIVIIFLATSGAIALMKSSSDTGLTETRIESTTPVQTLRLSLQPHQAEIRLLGKVEPEQTRNVASELSAEVISVNVKAGDYFEHGDLLLTLDAFHVTLSVAQAKADIADIETRIALHNAQQNLTTQAIKVESSQLALLVERLKQQRAVNASQQTLADLEQQIARQNLAVMQAKVSLTSAPLTLKQLQLQREKLELALSSAENQLSKASVFAPFAGQVASLETSEGQTVNPGSALMTLVSNENMRVKTSLPLHLASVRKGLVGFAGQQFKKSKVAFSYGDAQLLPGTAGLNSWFSLEDDEQWITGEIVELVLETPSQVNTLKIPVSALFQDKWIYSVDEEQRLSSIEVALLGRVREDNKDWLIVAPSVSEFPESRILVTRLKNPTSGLKIFERGIDPAPEDESKEVEETQAQQDSESDQ